MSPREKLLADALTLTRDDRIRLARELLQSVEPVELSPDDRAELDERIASMNRGEGIVVEDVDAFIDSLDM